MLVRDSETENEYNDNDFEASESYRTNVILPD